MGTLCNGCYPWGGDGGDGPPQIDLPGPVDDLYTEDDGQVPGDDGGDLGDAAGADSVDDSQAKDDPHVHDHHIFPRAFADWFEDQRRGIVIDDHCVAINDAFHSMLHSNSWNQEWQYFIETNPYATRPQAEEFAARLMDSWGLLEDYDAYLHGWREDRS
jgi:hypothetical protein